MRKSVRVFMSVGDHADHGNCLGALRTLNHELTGSTFWTHNSTLHAALGKTDVLFAWMSSNVAVKHHGRQYFEMGMAHAIGIPIVLGRKTGVRMATPFDEELFRLSDSYSGVKFAYDALMADADMFARTTWEKVNENGELYDRAWELRKAENPEEYLGLCVVCGGDFQQGMACYMDRTGQFAHQICYTSATNRSEPVRQSIYLRREMMEALREENSRLQEALRESTWFEKAANDS